VAIPLIKSASYLREGGRVFIQVPTSYAATTGMRYGQYWALLDIPHHLNFFSREVLSALCNRAGSYSPSGVFRPTPCRGAIRSAMQKRETDLILLVHFLMRALVVSLGFWRKASETSAETPSARDSRSIALFRRASTIKLPGQIDANADVGSVDYSF